MVCQLLKRHALLQHRSRGSGILWMIGDHLLVVKDSQVIFALIIQTFAHIELGVGSFCSLGIRGHHLLKSLVGFAVFPRLETGYAIIKQRTARFWRRRWSNRRRSSHCFVHIPCLWSCCPGLAYSGLHCAGSLAHFFG